MDVKTALEAYGFKEREAALYLGLLHLGSATAQQLAKRTGILRQTTYDLLDKLIEKGCVTTTQENNITHYHAEKPEVLLTIHEEKRKALQTILPALKKIPLSSTNTIAQQFRGLAGIKLLYEEFLTTKKELLTIQPEIPEELLKEYFIQNFLIKRVEKKIPIRILKRDIVTEFQKGIITDKKKYREVRLLSKLIDINTHIVIYDNTLVFIDYTHLEGVRITQPTFTQTQKTLFETLWNIGKQV